MVKNIKTMLCALLVVITCGTTNILCMKKVKKKIDEIKEKTLLKEKKDFEQKKVPDLFKELTVQELLSCVKQITKTSKDWKKQSEKWGDRLDRIMDYLETLETEERKELCESIKVLAEKTSKAAQESKAWRNESKAWRNTVASGGCGAATIFGIVLAGLGYNEVKDLGWGSVAGGAVIAIGGFIGLLISR